MSTTVDWNAGTNPSVVRKSGWRYPAPAIGMSITSPKALRPLFSLLLLQDITTNINIRDHLLLHSPTNPIGFMAMEMARVVIYG